MALLFLCAILCIASIYDSTSRRIPNWLIIGLVIGLLRYFYVLGDFGIIWKKCFYIGMSGVPFYVLFRRSLLGAGDVKLLSLSAGFLATSQILWFYFFTFLFASVLAVIHFIRYRDWKERIQYGVEYLIEGLRLGKFGMYFQDETSRRRASVSLAGSMLFSALLALGGVY